MIYENSRTGWFLSSLCTCDERSDRDVFAEYVGKDCDAVRREKFPRRYPTEEEQNFPIAHGLLLFNSADLAEKVLQAIYMPHNIYCIHIDVKSSEAFRHAIIAMTTCLENVFLVSEPVDVIWGHISLIHAQLNCLRDLMESSVKWKYFMNMGGQDLPLYENSEIVRALTLLNGTNNVESFPIPPGHNTLRALYSHKWIKGYSGEFHNKYSYQRTEVKKSPPPWGIKLKKGSNFVALTREAAQYILHEKTATDFLEWLSDTFAPDEAFYSSLQQHPGFPGGVHGKQSEWFMRAVRWKGEGVCHGWWVRTVCWVTIHDLSWILGRENRWKIFVAKIPFDCKDDFLACLAIARRERRYGQELLK